MEWDWGNALQGGAQGLLGGYTTILQNRSKADLQEKQNQALLQREKSLAKYKSTLRQEERDEQRKYDEANAFSGYYQGDRKLTQGQYDALTPEQKGGLLASADYEMQKKLDMTEKVYDKQQELAQKTKDKKVGELTAFISEQEGITGEKQEELRKTLSAMGITDYSEYKKATTEAAGKLSSDERELALKLATEEVNDTLTIMKDRDILAASRPLGYSGNNAMEAKELVKSNMTQAAFLKNSLLLKSAIPGTKSLLDISQFKEEEPVETGEDTPDADVAKKAAAVKEAVAAVKAGELDMNKVKRKNPVLAAEIQKELSTGEYSSSLPQPSTPSRPSILIPQEGEIVNPWWKTGE